MRHLVGVAGLKKTAHGSTCVIRPWLSVKPLGWFIHEFAATTENAPKIPDTTSGTPVHQCSQPGAGASRRGRWR